MLCIFYVTLAKVSTAFGAILDSIFDDLEDYWNDTCREEVAVRDVLSNGESVPIPPVGTSKS